MASLQSLASSVTPYLAWMCRRSPPTTDELRAGPDGYYLSDVNVETLDHQRSVRGCHGHQTFLGQARGMVAPSDCWRRLSLVHGLGGCKCLATSLCGTIFEANYVSLWWMKRS